MASYLKVQNKEGPIPKRCVAVVLSNGVNSMNSHRTHQWNHNHLGSKWTVHSNFLQSWSRPKKILRLRLGPFLMEKKWWLEKYSQDPQATTPRKQNRALTYIFPFPKTGEAGDIRLAEYENFNGLVKARFLLVPPFLNKSIYCSHPVLVSSSWLECVWNILFSSRVYMASSKQLNTRTWFRWWEPEPRVWARYSNGMRFFRSVWRNLLHLHLWEI